MSDLLDGSAQPAPRSPSSCPPVRLRATITIDLEAEDYIGAERLKAQIAADYDLLRRVHPAAELEFRQRKPRTGPRVGSPRVVVHAYVDD